MTSVTLEWTEPATDGGAPITAYVIEVQGPEDTEFHALKQLDGDILTYTATKLKPDTTYDFQVYAENEMGRSTDATRLDKAAKTKQKACG